MTSRSSITIDEIRLPPVHPGEILTDELAELGLSGTRFAREIDVPANRVTEILSGRRAITADTALRLARWFGTSAAMWMNLQTAYDLAAAARDHGQEIAKGVKPRAT